MRVAIYGAGAMGTALGAFIVKNGGEVQLVTRNKEHVEAINKEGIKICGAAEFTVKAEAVLPDKMTGKYDIVLLMTKQGANAEACGHIKDFLENDGVVCTLQNGLPEPSVAEVVGKERCLGCVMSWGATKVNSGVVRLETKPADMRFSLGSYFGYTNHLEDVKEILSLAGEVSVDENYVGSRWAKLAINAAFSSLSALTGMNFGKIAKDKKGKTAALKLINEVFDVAEKYGVEKAPLCGRDVMKYLRTRNPSGISGAKILLPFAMKNYKNVVSGMYLDLLAGRKCDIDYINGIVSHIGRKLGAPTPCNDAVLKLLHGFEERILNGESAQSLLTRSNLNLI